MLNTEWGGFSVATVEEIARVAETQNWQTAAHDYMRLRDHRAYRLAIDEYLAHLRFLLPLDESSQVLDLPCGWGALSFNLLTFVGSVVAMDDRPALLRFVAARKEQEGLDRLHVVSGPPTSRLPFADGAFDAVILSDGLREARSGAGLSRGDSPAAFLADVRRCLRPAGSLLIGGANRLGLTRASRAAAERPETYWGYAKLLRNAGFADLKYFAPFPSHREPYFIVPLDQPRLLYHFLDRMFSAHDYRSKLEARGLGAVYELTRAMWRLGSRLRLVGLIQYFTPSYLILAHR